MIKESIEYSTSRDSNLRYYIKSSLFMFSIVGIPLIFGNFTRSISENIDKNTKEPQSYYPYVETYLDGLLTIIFTFISLIIPLSLYLTIPNIIDSIDVSEPIFGMIAILLSLLLLISTLVSILVFPYLLSMQAYRKHQPILKDPYNVVEIFMSLYNSGSYKSIMKYFIIISTLITILVQLLAINPLISPFGMIAVILYYNMISYVISKESDAIINDKE